MNLIRVACIMLVVALFIGVITSGSHNNVPTASIGPENKAISSDSEGATGNLPASEENKSELPVSNQPSDLNDPDTVNSPDEANSPDAATAPDTVNTSDATNTPAALQPTPDPAVFEKGESKMAVEKNNTEKKVKSAVRLLEVQGEKLFPSFREKGSPWFQEGFCIFVWAADGTSIVSPTDTASEGKNMSGLVDSEGRPVGELFIQTAMSEKGEGWIESAWQQNGNSELSRRFTFVKRASFEGKTYIVGADHYLNNYIVCKSLEGSKPADLPGNMHITELLNPAGADKNLDLNCSIACSTINPGENIAPHLVSVSEVQYILEGEGLLYVDGIPVELKKDQLVYVPTGSVQTTYNTGSASLKFLVINQPAGLKENIRVIQ